MQYNLDAMQKMIKEAWSDEQLNSWTFAHFPDVYNEFTAGMEKSYKIRLLIDSCHKDDNLKVLVAQIEQDSPHIYEKWRTELTEPYLLNPLSLKYMKQTLKQQFQDWFDIEQADEHMRSSWAGMLIWMMGRPFENISGKQFAVFCIMFALWIVTGWVLIPFVNWSSQANSVDVVRYVLAILVVPLILTLISDVEGEFLIEERRDKWLLWYLRFIGAYLGYILFMSIIIVFSLVTHYLFVNSYIPTLIWFLMAGMPLLFAIVASKRVPVDRQKLFNTQRPQAHSVDYMVLFLVFFLGIAFPTFCSLYFDLLKIRIIGFIFLILISEIGIWSYYKENPEFLREWQLILLLGYVIPTIALIFALFVPEEPVIVWNYDILWATIILAQYVTLLVSVWLLVLLRNRLQLSFIGLFILVFIMGLALLGSYFFPSYYNQISLLLIFFFMLMGYLGLRNHLFIDVSLFFAILGFGLSLLLLLTYRIPFWLNSLGFAIYSIALTVLLYRLPTLPDKTEPDTLQTVIRE